MKRMFNFTKFCFYALLLGLIFIVFHLVYLAGGVNERRSKYCADPATVTDWQESLAITQKVCVEIQGGMIAEIKTSEAEETERWKNSYYGLKRECEKPEEEIINSDK